MADIYDMLENYFFCGQFDEFFIQSRTLTPQKSEIYFLCTDGISELFDDSELVEFLNKRDFAGLLESAKENARDNFTFVAIEVG